MSFIESPYFPYAFAIVLAAPFLVLMRQYFYGMLKLKNQELKMLAVKSNSESKLQAFERMVLLLERMKPSNLVKKFDKNLAPHEFLFLTEKSIQEEFEYNSSQQLFLSKNSWESVVDTKNAILQLAHKTYEGIKGDADLEEFKTIFLMNYVNGDDFVTQTIEELRKEALIVT